MIRYHFVGIEGAHRGSVGGGGELYGVGTYPGLHHRHRGPGIAFAQRIPGTVSDSGRDARDIMLGLGKTCMRLKLSFYEFLGARLGVPGPQISPLAELIRPAPS
jgi:hypothetical protein